ncbi:MAG: hypothetical protein Ct9H300mP15_09380 [Gemmatimonadota bacterium]|nr:MAG: hypothetical protein Ct9H300mP15_09380 [Gemmatimonadota bacterium]
MPFGGYAGGILQTLRNRAGLFDFPLNRAGALHRIGRGKFELLQELGREPTVKELAQEREI